LQGLDESLLKTCLPDDLPDREALLSMVKREISAAGNHMRCVLHTDTDADAFLQNGVLRDLPEA
jgi:hypothetical protein